MLTAGLGAAGNFWRMGWAMGASSCSDETGGDIGTAADGASEPVLPPQGHRCRDVVGVAMRAFLNLLDGASHDGTIPVEEVHRIAKAVMGADGALLAYYDRYSAACSTVFDIAKIERQRSDFFGRVVTQPFVGLLDDPASGISRKTLPHYFAAVRMMVGEEVYTDYKDRCTAIANEIRANAETIPWESFYADPRTLLILEETLAAIARSFRRFEARKEWFLIVMNNDPHAISLASNVFVTKSQGTALAEGFADEHFVRLFRALFASVHPSHFDPPRHAAFVKKYRTTPETLFGPLFVEIEMIEQRQTPARAVAGRGIEVRKDKKPKR